jgi:hypothetical protein
MPVIPPSRLSSASWAAFLTVVLATAAAQAQSAADDEALRQALQADRAAAAAARPPGAPAASATPAGPEAQGLAPATGSAAVDAQAAVRPAGTGVLNPNMSAIVDASFGYYGRRPSNFADIAIPESGDDPSAAQERQGFTLQEVELALSAAIDPYFQGAVFLTIPNLEGIEVEEAYFVTTALPWNLQVKGGSFRSQLGRNNGQHLHLQHFTRRPLMTPLLFGADGLRGPGAQISVLLPDLPWFATFYAEALSIGPPEAGEVTTFGGGRRGPESLAYTAVLEQFWALSDATSLQLGLNLATGVASECALPPCGEGRRDYLYGADLYVKWRPIEAAGELGSLSWSTEYFARSIAAGGPTEGAFYTEPVLQVEKRWFLGARLDLTGLPSGDNVPRRYGLAASVTFAPTEFSRLRLYGQALAGPGVATALVGFLQVEFSMGAHGAHPF